jgi:hypothetical protein
MFEDSDTDGDECKVCLMEHDEEIHAATLSIRQWWREQVTRNLYEECASDNPAAA